MAPTKVKSHKSKPSWYQKLKSEYLTSETVSKLVFNPHHILPTCVLLFIFEFLLNIFIIERVRYTEIDWVAYMQEVETFLNGTLDYTKIRGDTGPLVYPAGFVYIYSILYYITSNGKNIYLAQYIFMTIYLAQVLLNYRIHLKTCKVPPYALLIATLTSYRIHSIYVLRLFNDPVAVLLFYISLNLFVSNWWKLGSLFYSLAVSVKMNILLYAPCLLIAYLTNLTIFETFLNLFICGVVQLVLGAPFLYGNFWGYIKGSFDLGRVFEHKWTVNYRFLSREFFENRAFHVSLLALHILLLLAFLPSLKRYLSSYAKLNIVTDGVRAQIKKEKKRRKDEDAKLSKKERDFLENFENQLKGSASKKSDEFGEIEDRMSKIVQLFILPFYITNLIGISCARSLHYQFYSWYFFSILYMAFCTPYSKSTMFLLIALIEYCWNVYPSTDLSSGILHLCHFFIILGVYRRMRS